MNTSTTPKVQYGYATGSANTVRSTTITYPDGRVLTYSYGSTDSMPDALSRVAGIVDDDGGSTHLADYSYLGLGTFVEVDYTEPDIKYTLVGTAGGDDPDTGDIYRGVDRFGRVKDSYWRNYGNSTDVDRIKYGYDRNGSRLFRENTVATALGKSFDELYDYDLIDRLKDMARGNLDSGQTSITNKTFAQCWSLDATGNWRKFLEDSDGDGTWSLDQTRTANKVNEIANITESVGPSWSEPAYNRAGNMTTIPKPADPTAAFTATYDAWNRLVKLEDGSGTVAQYEYDGAKRRTVKQTYTSGTLSETRHLFYTEPSRWQVVEERVGTSTDRQFVWGMRYVDDIALRDRDTDSNGTLDERLYAFQDDNWNVTTLANVSALLQERFTCDAYGTTTALTPTFAFRGMSSFNWEVRCAGYCFDVESYLLSVRNRVLHTSLGMWLQRDPVGYGDNHWNLYEALLSNPLVYVDPLGLKPDKKRCEDWLNQAEQNLNHADKHINDKKTSPAPPCRSARISLDKLLECDYKSLSQLIWDLINRYERTCRDPNKCPPGHEMKMPDRIMIPRWLQCDIRPFMCENHGITPTGDESILFFAVGMVCVRLFGGVLKCVFGPSTSTGTTTPPLILPSKAA